MYFVPAPDKGLNGTLRKKTGMVIQAGTILPTPSFSLSMSEPNYITVSRHVFDSQDRANNTYPPNSDSAAQCIASERMPREIH
jgi:hypothetical protein